MSGASRIFFGLCLAALCGCSRCDDQPEKPKPDRAALPRERVRALSSARGPALSGFRGRLEQESKDRPAVPLKAEDVLAAFEKDGIVLDRKRQQMASPHFARYCMSAHTGEKVQITVCEHESAERADEHVAATQKLERPERRIAKSGTTTVLTRRDLNNDAEGPVVDKIMRSFEAMKPADAN
jgi:hypothetical protein